MYKYSIIIVYYHEYMLSGLILLIATLWEWSSTNEQFVIPLYIMTILLGGYYVAKSGIYGLRSYTLDSNFWMTIIYK